MRKTKSHNRCPKSPTKSVTYHGTDAIADDLLSSYLRHKQTVDEEGLMYLMSLTHNVLLIDQKVLGCTHPEMMARLLPWLEPSVVRALPAIFEHQLACTRRARAAA